MKIYDNGELIHVDSSKDIIEHFGIKGMKWGQRRALKKELRTLTKETGGKRTVAYHEILNESKRNSRLGTMFKSKRSLKYRINRLKEIRDIGKELDKNLASITLTEKDKQKIKEAEKYGKDFAEATKGSIIEEKEDQFVNYANKRASKSKVKY